MNIQPSWPVPQRVETLQVEGRALDEIWSRGATRFRCRRCHQLRYRSQRIAINARWENRANRLVRRLGGEAEDGHVYKPKWMRWATFHRLMDDVQDWNNAAFGYKIRGLMKPESWRSRSMRRHRRRK